MADKPRTHDEYLAGAREDQRAALERLRRTIHEAAPGALECISYGVPAFRLDGRLLVGYAAAAKHCSFFPMSPAVLDAHRDALQSFSTSKGTVRFQPDAPLPQDLVRRMVRERIAENAARR